MPRRILIRPQSGPDDGIGHLKRDVAVAMALRGLGFEPVFLPASGEAPRRLAEVSGFEALLFEPSGEEADFKEVLRLAGELAAECVVVDSFRLSEGYYRRMARVTKLVAFDDLARFPQAAHLAIDHNFGAEAVARRGADSAPRPCSATLLCDPALRPCSAKPLRRAKQRARYAGRSREPATQGEEESATQSTSPRTRWLLGPGYFPFRPAVVEAARGREPDHGGSRVLVAMGGSDPKRLVPKVLRALSRIPRKLSIRAVAGPLSSAYGELEEAAAASKHEVAVRRDVDELAPLIEWCDVGVIAGGTTKYEMALCGRPAATLLQAEDQMQVMLQYARTGTVLNLGPGERLGEEEIAAALEGFLADSGRRRLMSEAGRRLVDGLGASRIAEAVAELADRKSGEES